jgi:ABC-type molybdate transport system ATPase subunit
MKVLKHSFSYLKSTRLKECKHVNTIYLLGQNIAEVHWITKEKYLKYLEKISERFKGKIIYKPHRSEEVTKEYELLIGDDFVIEKEISQGPIEMALLEKKIYPKIIISFFSSALFSLEKIFTDCEIYAVRIENDDLVANQKSIEIVNECYEFFNNTGVKVVHL